MGYVKCNIYASFDTQSDRVGIDLYVRMNLVFYWCLDIVVHFSSRCQGWQGAEWWMGLGPLFKIVDMFFLHFLKDSYIEFVRKYDMLNFITN